MVPRQAGEGGAGPLEHIALFGSQAAQEEHARKIREWIGKRGVPVDRAEEIAAHDVKAGEQLDRRSELRDLVEQRGQPLVGGVVEAKRRVPQLVDAGSHRAARLGVEPGVQPEPALRLPLGHRRQCEGGEQMERRK